jgi:adenylate cyclase
MSIPMPNFPFALRRESLKRFRLPRKARTISGEFETEFALEILKSDQLRVTILLFTWLTAMPIVAFVSVLFFDQFNALFHGQFRGFLISFVIGIGCAGTLLTLERVTISHFIKQRRDLYRSLQYFSALIETSFPALGMFAASQFLGPIHALFTPAPFAFALFIVLSILRLDFRLCVFTGGVAALEYGAMAAVFVSRTGNGSFDPFLSGMPHHLLKAFLLLLTGVVAGVVTLQIKKRILKSFEMIEERNRISRTFGEYVSPEVMDTLMALKPDLRSESKSVCVMFLDIRNFTGFAEKRTPEEVVEYLESLFDFMIEIVNRHHGIINKFLGDGFMAVFGAPLTDGRDCANALAAAREILERVQQEVELGRILPTTVGIGLHFGEAVTGSIGSALRREYTVIGDVVNLAARIEKLNKRFGSHLLISDVVRQAVGSELPDAVSMGQVKVKGREEGIQIYQLA